MELKKYLAAEGSRIDRGTPVARVENYWAVIMLKANGKGILKKTFFEPGVSVKIGDPIAIIGADGENIPNGKEYTVVEVIEHKRKKPIRQWLSATAPIPIVIKCCQATKHTNGFLVLLDGPPPRLLQRAGRNARYFGPTLDQNPVV